MATTTTARKTGPLNGFFHYAEKGGTFSGEITAGIVMAVLAVCGMFMNMQAVSQFLVNGGADADMMQTAANGEIVAAIWLLSMLVATLGSVVMGLVARLPFVQVSSLSLTTVIVATVGLHSGLTYYNVLLLSFIASVIYVVLAVVPALRSFLAKALPNSVRTALPAAAGLLMTVIAAQLSGIFNSGSASLVNYGTPQNIGTGNIGLLTATTNSKFSYLTDLYHPQMLLAALAGVLAAVIFLVYARRRRAGASGKALLWGTLFFLVACMLLIGVNWKTMKMSLSFLWGRLWMVGAEDAMQAHVAAAFAALSPGAIFTYGADFSGFVGNGGNVALLASSVVLNFVFLLMYDAESTAAGVALQNGEELPNEESLALPLTINAATNVVAGLFGASPVALGKESVAGAKDGAKSGLSTVVAAIVFLVSAFVWVIPAIFVTITSYSITFNLYGHYGKVLYLLTQSSFTVADVVMAMVGITMVAKTLEAGLKGVAQTVPYVATLAITLLTTNLALGVAAGTVANALVLLRGPRKGSKAAKRQGNFVQRLGGTEQLVWACVSLLVLVLAFLG